MQDRTPADEFVPRDDAALLAWRAARRAELLAARQGLTRADRASRESALLAHLRTALADVRGTTIAYYIPFRGEPDLRVLAEDWRTAGARTALPVVVGRGVPLEFRLWWPGAPVRKGAFSLPMPDGTPLVTPDVVLLPPVGFDARGFRLGYGGGYFDRTLAVLAPAPLKIGVAYELSRMTTIHAQPHDIPMDFIVTEAGLHRVTANGLATLPPGTCVRRRPGSAPAADDDIVECASPPCYAGAFERGP